MLVRDETLAHGGREYRITAETGANFISVRSFSEGKALGHYQVGYETAFDFQNAGNGDALEHLMEWARSDIFSGRLSEVMQALSQ
jgi:hypothetical protein